MNELRRYTIFQEVVYRDEKNERQIGKVIGYYPDGDFMIKDLVNKVPLRIPLAKIDGLMEI